MARIGERRSVEMIERVRTRFVKEVLYHQSREEELVFLLVTTEDSAFDSRS